MAGTGSTTSGVPRTQDPAGARGTRGTVPERRWPRPEPTTLALLLVWLGGIAVATIGPWFIVPPTAVSPEPARVWLASGVSALGIAIFSAAGIVEYRRTRNPTVLTWGLIPGVSIGLSLVIFTATLLSV